MIRIATVDDLDWIADSCLDEFNNIYEDKVTRTGLKAMFLETVNSIYVYDDRSAFINTINFEHKGKLYQSINGWWSNKKGNGIKLLRHCVKIGKGRLQSSMLHENEHRLMRVLEKMGYKKEAPQNGLVKVWKQL